MKFLFDNCLSPKIARSLARLEENNGVTVVPVREVMKEDSTDTEWIEYAKTNDFVVITNDRNVKKNSIERKALDASKINVLFVPNTYDTKTFWIQAAWFVKYWPTIKENTLRIRSVGCHDIREHGQIDN